MCTAGNCTYIWIYIYICMGVYGHTNIHSSLKRTFEPIFWEIMNMHIKLQRSSEPWLLSCLYKLSKKSFPFSTKSTSARHSTAQRGTQTCGQTPFSRTCALTHTGAFTKSKTTWWLSNHESRNPVFILLKILQIFFYTKEAFFICCRYYW